jgi:14-3-3 protein epsilon
MSAVIGARRASWRIVSSIEGKEEVCYAYPTSSLHRELIGFLSQSKGNTSQVAKIKREWPGSDVPRRATPRLTTISRFAEYREKIESELGEVCNDILSVLDQYLIPSAQAGESKVRRNPPSRSPSSPPPRGLACSPFTQADIYSLVIFRCSTTR